MSAHNVNQCRTGTKESLWALKPGADKYSFVAISNEEKNEMYKKHFLGFYPESTFKVAKKIPQVK